VAEATACLQQLLYAGAASDSKRCLLVAQHHSRKHILQTQLAWQLWCMFLASITQPMQSASTALLVG
jgi:hypothetical protein